MRLRSMEMQGFKSFPDKIRLEFNDGITAVVGPNGSGKSNIADAMRWVLGEQSSKTLRGGKMEDVIFGGTQKRRPQGYAMVQMTMDNRDRTLEFDADEVTVSRRLYRSGDSEYSINGTSVRLKDIHQMFMDTGLGRDGYSIIGQGKIAEIVGAKSKERREIFEEAAGIAKFRYRREEAQRSLNNAQENLLRLKDILTELENRVEPLREQAEKAEKFLRFSAEKQSLEVSLWVRTLNQSKTVLREQEDKIQLQQNQYDEVQQQLNQWGQELQSVGEQLRAVTMQIDDQTLFRRRWEEQLGNLSREKAVTENDLSHKRSEQLRLEGELEALSKSKETLQQELAQQQEKASSFDQVIAEQKSRRDKLREQFAETKLRLESVQKEIEGLKERRFALNQSISDKKIEGATAASRLEETKRYIESMKENSLLQDENLQQILREQEDCRKLLETLRESVSALENQHKGYEMRKKSQQERLNSMEEQQRRLFSQGKEKESRAQMLADLEKRMEGFGPSVKYITGLANQGALQGVFGPVSRLFQVEEKYALAIEIALGSALQNIVVDTEQTAKKAIGILKSQQKGRATFLPMNTVKGNVLTEPWLSKAEGFMGLGVDLIRFEERFTGVLNQLLGRIVVAEDLDAASEIAKRGNHRFRVVTLDGQLMNVGGSMTGGYVTRTAGILSRSHEIQGLLREAEGFRAKAKDMEEALGEAKEKLSADEGMLLGVAGELQTAQEDIIRAQAQQTQLERSHKEAMERKKQALQEYDRMISDLERLETAGHSHQEMLAGMQSRLDEVQSRLSEETSRQEDFTEQQSATQTDISALELEMLSVEKDKQAQEALCNQLNLQLTSGSTQEQHLRESAALCEEECAALSEKLESIAQEQEQVKVQTEESEGVMKQLRERRDELQTKEAEIRLTERSLLEDKERFGREMTRLSEKYEQMKQSFDELVAKLWDEYELTQTQAEESALPVEDVSAANRRLSEIRSQIKQLGSVNVAALEEYKEVKERYETLLAQTNDVEKTRKELLRLIERLTGEMQTMFLDSFQEINSHFSQIFVQLFGGGQADLSLSEPDNVLESGVEIKVQPPGKVIGSLTALSGGEQAFVAIALYFAILKVRPSPFVLLDEIEAALDDVNVTKYANYLRTISDKTQFITITHRRGTMEEADVLYGVTMEEKGVSKLLVLQVSEISSKLGL